MKKIFTKMLAAAISMAICCSVLIGCSRTPDHDQFLEIYCLDIGYGWEWTEALAKDFGELDWVKEKYPDYDFKVNHNDRYTFASETIGAGPNGNSTDIMFFDSMFAVFSEQYNGESVAADLTEIVYKQKVPGEDILFEDKMSAAYRSANIDQDTGKYRSVSWQAGMISILYNATLFEKLELKVPNTTDELIGIAEDVKEMGGKNENYKNPPKTEEMKGPRDYAFTASPKVNYWRYAFPVWWAQYEGYEQYSNFYNGIVDNIMS